MPYKIVMMKLLMAFCLLPIFSFAQIIKPRQYKPGETYKYKLTTEVYRGGKFSSKEVSISAHKVISDAGVAAEEISWLSKTSFTPKDTLQLDSIAKKVKPYKISLSPQGKVLLPKLTIPEMVGNITDLNTFFVAISPAMNMHKLSAKDSSFTNEKPAQGNFGDSIVILYGTDCIIVSQHLLSSTKNYSIVRTDFMPPANFCLIPLLDTVAKKIFNQENNFQMIQKGTGDKVNFFWGVESFSITSKIDNKTGEILEADMTNDLSLRMRYNSSADLKTYAVEMPITIKRVLKLELLKD